MQLNECLEELELQDLTPRECKFIQHRIEQLVNQSWHTNEIRQQRPTPVDEAKWGLRLLKTTCGLPFRYFFTQLDDRLQENFGIRLPLHAHPIRIASWMGGTVTVTRLLPPKVTQEVLLLSRWSLSICS